MNSSLCHTDFPFGFISISIVSTCCLTIKILPLSPSSLIFLFYWWFLFSSPYNKHISFLCPSLPPLQDAVLKEEGRTSAHTFPFWEVWNACSPHSEPAELPLVEIGRGQGIHFMTGYSSSWPLGCDHINLYVNFCKARPVKNNNRHPEVVLYFADP